MDSRIANLPLNGLRAFEAAARHLSFTAAAEELAVTPAAVSHQIRGLEDRLGVRLFERKTRAVVLTEAGLLIAPEATQGFQTLQRAVSRLATLRDDSSITVTASPSIAAQWLLPRLDRFDARHPGIDLRISASNEVVDFSTGAADVALRFGRGNYPGLHVDCLTTVDLFPVCAPHLATPEKPLDRPTDLAHHTLLHDDSWAPAPGPAPGWDMWLKALGVTGVDHRRGERFDSAVLTTQAAILGRGVALSSRDMLADDLATGRLIRPFEGNDSLDLEFGIYFVCPPEALDRPNVAAFHDWVLDEFCVVEAS